MGYTREDIHNIVEKQREFFLSNQTLDLKFRITQLKKLRKALEDNQEKLEKALYEDLGRCDAEAYFCDIGDVIMEINECIKGFETMTDEEVNSIAILDTNDTPNIDSFVLDYMYET